MSEGLRVFPTASEPLALPPARELLALPPARVVLDDILPSTESNAPGGRHFRKGRLRRWVVPWGVAGAVAAAAVAVAVMQIGRPLPRLTPTVATQSELRVSGSDPALPLPADGEALVDVEGGGVLGSSGGDAPAPLASVTKMMTALVVLDDHPVAPGTQGAEIAVTPEDVAIYQAESQTADSVVEVAPQEELTEVQALQGLLLASADNFADMLAIWDAGSAGAFVAKMNAEAASLGLSGTHYVEPSGLDPQDVGSPSDQIRLAEVALENPTFASIVSETAADLPVAGPIYNVNFDLGHEGIVGVKTGNTQAAGGCVVFEARQEVGGVPETVIGAVFGQQGSDPLFVALGVAQHLVQAAFASLGAVTVVDAGETLGRIDVPWATPVGIEAARRATVVAVAGTKITESVRLSAAAEGMAPHTKLGSLTVDAGTGRVTIPLVTAAHIPLPTLAWRLVRP